MPNVNQSVGHAVDRILQLLHPTRYASDRVVISVAMLQSGAVYNHKPETGWFSLDVRARSMAPACARSKTRCARC